jgi:DNA-directed RNA polymerase subunit M/transcription elongation factor TFIIS
VAGVDLDGVEARNVAALRLEHAIFFSSPDLLRYASNSLLVLNLVRSLTQVINPEMIAYAAIHTMPDERNTEDEVSEDDAPALQLCPKCSSRATFSQKQTRSADEGFTIFFECTNAKCKHKWVQS